MAPAPLGSGADINGVNSCRGKDEATKLKSVAVAVILFGSALGVLLPILGKKIKHLNAESSVFFVVKVFASGVILATGFVHVLPHGEENLGNRLDKHPWQDYPMAGLITMAGALFTLVIDFAATQYFERKKLPKDSAIKPDVPMVDEKDMESGANTEDGHVPAAAVYVHSHSHAHGGTLSIQSEEKVAQIRIIVVSQVLELGLVTHSLIIGIGLGVSNSPCSIRPLIAALVFHQMFEGFALGGCIAQAGFKNVSAWVMAFFFSVTTPLGIAIGMGIQSSYDENSQLAFILEGTFNCFSAGILIYMALVDLIATDFLSTKLRSSTKLQVWSYLALFTGAGTMALSAIGSERSEELPR